MTSCAVSKKTEEECDIEYPGFDDEQEDEQEPVLEEVVSSLPLPEELDLRPMQPRDLAEVKRLHEQCFPVRYDRAFYQNVVRGFIVRGKGQLKEPLYTEVAVLPLDADSDKASASSQGNATPVLAPSHADTRASDETRALLLEHQSPAFGMKLETADRDKGAGCAGDNSAESCATDSMTDSADSNNSNCSDQSIANDGDAHWCAIRRQTGEIGHRESGTTLGIRRRQTSFEDDENGYVHRKNANCNKNDKDRFNDKDRCSDDEGPGRVWPSVAGDDDVTFVRTCGGDRVVEKSTDQIVGLITCQVLPLARCADRQRLGLHNSGGGEQSHSEVVYILTLGTEMAYRRRGIGRALLRRCVWLSRQEASIGAIYLHVITTNPPAHRFYESEGFVQVCCIDDYYKIDGELYDCFLYALYVNGAQPPVEEGWSIGSISRSLLDVVSFFRRTLGYVPEDGKLAAAVAAASGSGTSSSASSDNDEESAERSPAELSPKQLALENDFRMNPSPRKRRQSDSSYASAVSAAAAAGALRDMGGRKIIDPQERNRQIVSSESEREIASTARFLPRGRAFAAHSPAYACSTTMAAPRGAVIDRGDGKEREMYWNKNGRSRVIGASLDAASGVIFGGTKVGGATFGGRTFDGGETFGRGRLEGLRDERDSQELAPSPISRANDRTALRNGFGSDRFAGTSSRVERAGLWDAAASTRAWRAGGVSAESKRADTHGRLDDDEWMSSRSDDSVIEVGRSSCDVDLTTTNLDGGRCLEWESGATVL